MTFKFDKKSSFLIGLYGTSALVSALIYCAHAKSLETKAKSLETKAKNLNLAAYRLYKATEKILQDPEDNNKKNK